MQKGWYFKGRYSLTCAVEPREFLLVGVANQQQTGKNYLVPFRNQHSKVFFKRIIDFFMIASSKSFNLQFNRDALRHKHIEISLKASVNS